MKKWIVLLAVTLFLAVALFGCAEEAADEAPEATPEERVITLTDLMGREVVIEGAVETIISLSPSNTELLFALGLGEKVVGVTDFCNYPPEAAAKKSVGGFSDPNLEVILTLEPDLVLAGSLHEEAVTRLEERGIPALVLEPSSVEQIYDSITLVGAAAGVEAAAAAVVSEIQGQISGVVDILASLDEAERVPVYYELWYDPIMSIGNHSFIHEVITLAGGQNIFADVDDNYPVVSSEAVADKNPLVILHPDDHGSAELVKAQFNDRPGWSGVGAIRNDRIYGVQSDLFSRSGPRVGQAVQKAAALFYPELFEN